ncbi:hypothetical protein [Sulfuriferula sp.]|uniref:hypothetical protein n=1 Tax=Sulfuriferula sp. TaxID=2025307 RepID=UPI0027321F06|nr:hypothetical protein [Sulfuriferula sp.]MDP2026451.1 hypothetical protein [Sulfuriferula sp.]
MKKLLVLCLIALSGCASSAIPLADSKPVPSARLFQTENRLPDGNSRVVFIRDTGLIGSGVYNHVYIDGQLAASLNPGERAEFVLVPGTHIIGVIPTNPFGTFALNTIDQDLKPDQSYFYRILTDGNSMRTVVQRFIP